MFFRAEISNFDIILVIKQREVPLSIFYKLIWIIEESVMTKSRLLSSDAARCRVFKAVCDRMMSLLA